MQLLPLRPLRSLVFLAFQLFITLLGVYAYHLVKLDYRAVKLERQGRKGDYPVNGLCGYRLFCIFIQPSIEKITSMETTKAIFKNACPYPGTQLMISHTVQKPERLAGMKRRILILLTAIFIYSVSPGQTIQRQDNETVEAFVKRLLPDTTTLAHPVIETNVWGTSAKALIVFYGYDDPNDPNTGFNKIFGHLYFPTGQNNYRDISFGPIEEDGGLPEIISVFFSNADKDSKKELIVLCKYDVRHYDVNGDYYATFIFDNPGDKKQLTYFEKLSQKFGGCDCSRRTGEGEIARYKNAKAINAGLKKMGF